MTKSRMIELPTPADVERQREAIKERLLKTLNNNTMILSFNYFPYR